MESPYTDVKPEIDGPTTFQRVLKWLFLLAAVGMGGAAILTITGLIGNDEVVNEVQVRYPYGSLSKLTELHTFNRVYLSVNGSAELVEHTQSVQVKGVLRSDGEDLHFKLLKKQPDRVLFSVNQGSSDMTIGVSGDTVWKRLSSPQHEAQVTLLEGDAANNWLDQRSFFDRIVNASLGQGSLVSVEVTQWQGDDCLKASIRDNDDGPVVDILIDPQTMYPIVELAPLADGTVKQVVFGDYQVVEGMPIAFSMITSIDGVEINQILLEDAKLNSGIASYLFELPAQ